MRALFLALLVALSVAGAGSAQSQSDADLPKKLRPPAHPKFRWPILGPSTQQYGSDGIDIVAPIGEPVHAAAEGVVLYAGDELKTYGNLVLIRHADNYVTAYAGLSEILVARGVKVRRGEIIGKSGDTGDVESPRLHFELRKDGSPIDPKGYMAPM